MNLEEPEEEKQIKKNNSYTGKPRKRILNKKTKSSRSDMNKKAFSDINNRLLENPHFKRNNTTYSKSSKTN